MKVAAQTALTRSASEQAELLLEQGRSLMARARSEQKPGLYRQAESHLSSAILLFENLELWDRRAVAQNQLATCYWRRGQNANLNKARAIVRIALTDLPIEHISERLSLTNTLLTIEVQGRNYEEVIRLSPSAIADAELVGDAYRLAQAHSNFAHALMHLDISDRAIIEYTAASVHFEEAAQAGHALALDHLAATDANLAELLVKVGRVPDARIYLNRAQRHYEATENKSALGQVYETRAQCYEAARMLDDALEAIETSIRYLEGGDEKGLLADSLKTRDRIKLRMGLLHQKTKPPNKPQSCRLRLVKGGKAARRVDLFSVTIGEDDYSLADLGPDYMPGCELIYIAADNAPDDVVALIQVAATGEHHLGYLIVNTDGSACIRFANSDPADPYPPRCFKSRAEVRVVGVPYKPTK